MHIAPSNGCWQIAQKSYDFSATMDNVLFTNMFIWYVITKPISSLGVWKGFSTEHSVWLVTQLHQCIAAHSKMEIRGLYNAACNALHSFNAAAQVCTTFGRLFWQYVHYVYLTKQNALWPTHPIFLGKSPVSTWELQKQNCCTPCIGYCWMQQMSAVCKPKKRTNSKHQHSLTSFHFQQLR